MKTILGCLILVVAVANFSSCKKGCTDKNAVNYDSSAKKNDGNCAYTGSIVFWYDSLKTSGSIRVTMEDSTTGTITYDASGTGPDCDKARYFTYTAAPGIYPYIASLTDNIWGNKITNGYVTITSGICAEKNISF